MNIPSDPAILLSYINTKLRDTGQNLDELSGELFIEKKEIIKKLESIGYTYNQEKNCFA